MRQQKTNRHPGFLPGCLLVMLHYLVATAPVVATTGVDSAAAVATATVRTEKNDNDQKNDPAVVAQKVHLFPSLRALNSYYVKGKKWCRIYFVKKGLLHLDAEGVFSPRRRMRILRVGEKTTKKAKQSSYNFKIVCFESKNRYFQAMKCAHLKIPVFFILLFGLC